MNPDTALGRLLPLLMPPDRWTFGSGIEEALQTAGWALQACQRGLGSTLKVFLSPTQCWDLVSEENRGLLEAAYLENLAKWVVREQVLRELLPVFHRAGIRPVLLKGLAFASQLYPDIAARQAGDIDLLVDYALRDPATEILQRAGFRRISQPTPIRPRLAKRLLRRAGGWLGLAPASSQPAVDEGEGVYVAEAGGEDIMVEIHYHLINLRAGGGKEEVFRSRSEGMPETLDVELPVGRVRLLAPDAAFLHALRHVALHHRFIGFRWHHDLALMLVRWPTSLRPEAIRRRCRELGSEKILDVELALLDELFGPGVLPKTGATGWRGKALPWEYPLYRYIARGGKRTASRELVRTLLAPSLREQVETLT